MRILSLVLSVFLCLSCSSFEMIKALDDVESYIKEHPDSALIVLDSMDRTLLSTDRVKAHHALLYAMALDKNYIDVRDDSIAQIAVDYYSKYDSGPLYVRSLYYLGLAYYYQGAYDKAILEFTKAEKSAVQCDSLYLGFIYYAQANTYDKTYNDSQVRYYLNSSYKVFADISEEYYRLVLEMELARNYLNSRDYVMAEGLYESLLSTPDLPPMIESSALVGYAFMQATRPNPDYHHSCELFSINNQKYANARMTPNDYWVWAFALDKIGRAAESDSLTKQLLASGGEYVVPYWQYRIARSRGNDNDALCYLESAASDNYQKVSDALDQSLSSVQRNFFQSQAELYDYRLQMHSNILLLIIALGVLAAAVAYFIINKYISNQKKERNDLLEYVEEVNRQLKQTENNDYQSLRNKYVALYKSRFEAIGELCNQYLQYQGRADIEKLMFNKVAKMVEEIRNDAFRKARFEAILNEELNDIMSNLRAEMPKLKENDITLFSYLVAGFNSTTISRLMDMSLNNVYAHKRRLRLKIEEKNPPHSADFLEMIV